MQSQLTFTLAILVAARSEEVYKRIGGEVILKPEKPQSNPKSIVWKDYSNIAVEWDGSSTEVNRHFKDRVSLDSATGELTIKRLTPEFNAVYTYEINNIKNPNYEVKLIVISPVPKPEISLSCNKEKNLCNLTCNVHITGADPITYKWRFNNTEQENGFQLKITPEMTAETFICEIENPVSKNSSDPVYNPFDEINERPFDINPKKIHTGLIVFSVCFLAVFIMVVIHRFKAGIWFFQKESRPWEKEFWRKVSIQEPDRANRVGHERDAMIGEK